MAEASAIRSKPEALTVKRKIAKKPIPSQIRSPIIVYVTPPEVIEARPEHFMAVVQRLTGKDSEKAVLSNSPASSGDGGRSGREEDEFRGGKAESSSFVGFRVGANPNWRDFGLTL